MTRVSFEDVRVIFYFVCELEVHRAVLVGVLEYGSHYLFPLGETSACRPYKNQSSVP